MSLILCFSYFYAYFMLGYVRVKLAPQGLERGIVRAPQGLELEIKGGEVICVPRVLHGIVPVI